MILESWTGRSNYATHISLKYMTFCPMLDISSGLRGIISRRALMFCPMADITWGDLDCL